MSQPISSRGDALAETILRALAQRDGDKITADELEEFVRGALDAYRSTAPTGERVRLAVWSLDEDGSTWCGPDTDDGAEIIGEVLGRVYGAVAIKRAVVEFTIPPRPAVPECEGSVERG